MPIELIRNPIKVCKIVGEDVFSSVVEEDINVPDVNPDLYKIIAPSATVQIRDCEILTDKVVINGRVLMNILYAADEEGRPLNSMDVSADFSQSIEILGAKPRMKENVSAVIQHIDCYMINSRKVNIKAIMDLRCRVEDVYDLELASDVRGISDIQVLREPYSFKQLVGVNKDRYDISEVMELPADKPVIGSILKSDCRAILKEEKLSDGKAELVGVLGVSLIYIGEDESRSVNYVEFEVPFTQYIEIPAADRNMECAADIALTEYFVDGTSDENGENRAVSVNAQMSINARVCKTAEADVVIDAYSPGSVLELHKDIYRMNELVGRGRSNVVLKESLSIQHGDPEIEKACCVNVMPVVNEVRIMDDRVVVEGIMDTTAIYMSSYSAEPMCSINEQIPFRHFIDISGARLGMDNVTDCRVDSVTFSQMNSEMLELRVVLSITSEVTKQIEKKMVNRIEQVEGVAFDYSRMPAVTIYIVQKGDTLWSIAKRYSTTVDALVKLNSIDNLSRVAPGTQIMILKSIRAS